MDTAVVLFNTQLKDRVLWFDGDSSFDPDRIIAAVQTYAVQFVTQTNEIVDQYNQHVTRDKTIKVKTGCNPLDIGWNLPEPYRSMDILPYISNQHAEITAHLPQIEQDARDLRLAHEINLYVARGLTDVLRAIIYIINRLTATNTVWGVGRGSSVSSYVLYVIGVHDVDSYAYELNIEEFLHN